MTFISALPALKSTTPYLLAILKYHNRRSFLSPQRLVSLVRQRERGGAAGEGESTFCHRGTWLGSGNPDVTTFVRAMPTFTFTRRALKERSDKAVPFLAKSRKKKIEF